MWRSLLLAFTLFISYASTISGFVSPVSPLPTFCHPLKREGRRSVSSLRAEALPEDGAATSASSLAEGDTSPAASGAGDDLAAESKLNLAQQKAALMRLILSTSMGDGASQKAAEDVNAIIERLEGLRQGFQEERVDGEWVLCFTRNAQGSPSLQKALPGDRGFQNFDVKSKKFCNIVKFWGGKVQVRADLSYSVAPTNPDRLEATIVAAGVKLGPLRVPLPLKGRVGYLEFVYQDDDIRVTRGNRGGLFLHMRPGSSFSMGSAETGAAPQPSLT